jgi:hypothetical protein
MKHFLILIAIAGTSSATALQHSHQVDRAQQAMGFDQQKTIHHFRLDTTGGAIEVTVKDPSDRASLEQIRTHGRHITTAFEKGDFTLPFLVHAAEPPGVSVMKERRALMTYRFEEIPLGGRVIIRTSDAAALSALHDFLRFQIREHRTGDPVQLRKIQRDAPHDNAN